LSNILRRFPDFHPDLQTLLTVGATEKESFDFFKSICDIQVHKRIRALIKFQKLMEIEKFSQNSTLKLFLPLFTSMVDIETDSSLLHELSKSIGLLTKPLNWPSYYRTLKRFLTLIDKAEHKDRILLKIICDITEHFHFGVGEVVDEEKATKIETILCKEIIPDLRKHLRDSKTGQMVRVNVAISIVKLIKHLPQELQEEQLPAIITGMCHALQSREQSDRDGTRQSLLSIATYLGPTYFYFIVQEMKGCLTRGYQEHVLGYTIHYLLHGLVPTLKVGDLDYCLDTVLEILLEDSMGEVASKKEVEAVAKSMKETKAQTSYDSFQLLAQILTFPDSFKVLVDTFHNVLINAESTKVRNRLERILNQITKGLRLNTSVTQENILVFIFNITTSYLDISTKKAVKEAPVTPPPDKKLKNDSSLLLTKIAPKQKSYLVTNSFMLVDFGLQLLNNYVKKRGFFDIRSRATDEMLDPFISLLVKCMQCNSISTAILAMKCLSVLLHMTLPSSPKYLGAIKDRLFDLVKGSGEEATKQCFKLISVLLNKYSYIKIEYKQLNAIVHLVDSELETTKQTATFSLLKSILYRKYICPEIYDLMIRVSFFIVKSDIPHIRQQSSELFIQFLLHYPLGATRLQQHLDFLINNLGYATVYGREAVLEVLLAILQKFPQEVINPRAEYLFLPLVVRLVNEDTESCKKLIADVIKALVSSVDDSKLNSIWSLMDSWLSNQQENEQLYMASIQVLLLLLDVHPNLVVSKIDPILSNFVKRIEEHNILSESYSNNDWQLTYLTLNIVEKLFQIKPSYMSQDLFTPFWNRVSTLLDSNHAWIRTVVSRILGVWFNSLKPETFYEDQSWIKDSTELGVLAKSLLHQLNTERISDSLAEQTMKNLIYIAKAHYHNPVVVEEDKRSPQHYLFHRLSKMATKFIDFKRVN
jgi:U3 small nucleolar RNA-associated protein 20